MALTIQDLQPQGFKITIKGLELDCKPPRMSHMMVMSKVGELFQDTKSASLAQIQGAQKEFDWLTGELIPELQNIELDMQSSLDVITQIMEKISPEENVELKEQGVKLPDPKDGKNG